MVEEVYTQADTETTLNVVLHEGSGERGTMSRVSRARRPPGDRKPEEPVTTYSRALSSVGLERLPYKQEVAGSNPAAPIV